MENQYVIFTDSSADIDRAYIDSGKVKFIPMEISVGDNQKTYSPDCDKSFFDEFFAEVRKGTPCSTTQITPYIYEETFSPYLEKGISVIYLSLSGGLSSTYQSALNASEKLNAEYTDAKFYPIDSLSATGGMGIILEELVANQDNGLSFEENINKIEEFKKYVVMAGYVESLLHLKRGGRISAATAVVGTLLNIKPIIRITSVGKLLSYTKETGSKKATLKLFSYFKENYDFENKKTVYVIDSGNEKNAELLVSKIKETDESIIVKRVTLSPIIGGHLGADSVVIAFKDKQTNSLT